jgi:hypothetical protein
LVGVAVKVTGWPAQIEVAGALILTEGSIVEPTDMIIAFEVSFEGLAQLKEEVISTVTISPFSRPEFW